MSTISVIIPAYNAEGTILDTIESVRQQTFRDLEILVINDGSSDRTLELLSAIDEDRLKIYSYPNGGLPTARNRGIAKAKGEYISFIDADDLWTKDKLEKQLNALRDYPEAGVAYSWIAVMMETDNSFENPTFFSGKKVFFKGDIYTKLLISNFIGNGSNILVKRELINTVGYFDPSLKSCEDWDYYLRLANHSHFAVVPEHQIMYRRTPGAMTSKGSIMEREGLKVIERVFRTVPPSLQSMKNRSIANFYRYCGKIYIDCASEAKDIQQSKTKLIKAIALDPLILFNLDTYFLLFKIILIQLLPKKVVKNLIYLVKKPFAMKQLQNKILTKGR